MWFYIHFTMNKSYKHLYDFMINTCGRHWFSWDLESRFHFCPFSFILSDRWLYLKSFPFLFTLLDRWLFLKSFPFSIALSDRWLSLKSLKKKLNRYKSFVWFYIDFTMNTCGRHWFSWDLKSQFHFRPFSITLSDRWLSLKSLTKKLNRYKSFVLILWTLTEDIDSRGI